MYLSRTALSEGIQQEAGPASLWLLEDPLNPAFASEPLTLLLEEDV